MKIDYENDDDNEDEKTVNVAQGQRQWGSEGKEVTEIPKTLSSCKPSRRLQIYTTVLAILASFLFAGSVCAQDKITYADNILPLVEANCSKCHNPDKRKADMDLTSYQGALKGSGSGSVLISGNPEASKLWKAITHAEEPFMPPNRPKLADKDLDLFRKWILGGLLETAGGKAIAPAKPAQDLTLKADAIGRPAGPPPMPKELPLEPVVHTVHRSAITGLAASPWAPLIAVAGQKQVLLFHSDTLELLGILPFTEGQPVELKFSGSGKLLLAGGGRGARSGRVLVWDVVTGERLMTLGEEYDTVLAADIRPDQSQVAFGGPSRLVKIWSTKSGELQHKMKKLTDWVTAIAFSPNGQMLASADRNGGISLWDPDSAQELFTLAGHKAAVTALSWRGDSKLLASASEDGSVKLWEMQEGKQAKSWTAHGPGAASVNYTHDGRLVTCGRDNAVTLWDANGGRVRNLESVCDLPLRAAFSHDGGRIFAADFDGRVAVWNTADGKRIGELNANPLPLADQIAAAKKRLAELQAPTNQTVKEAGPGTALAEAEAAVEQLEAAQVLTAVYRVREDLAARKREHDRLAAAVEAGTQTIRQAKKALAAATHDAAAKTGEQLKSARAEVARSRPAANRLAAEIKAEQTRLDQLLAQHRLMTSSSNSVASLPLRR